MKCNIAKDLMALYVEGMCSEESMLELEAHLKECGECAKMYDTLKMELSGSEVLNKRDYTEANKADLKPMKKVKKSLFRRRLTSVILGMLLLVVLIGIGILSYGQVTNRGMSFSAIADAYKIKNICEKLTEGDTQALLDVIPFRIEDVYNVKNEDSMVEGLDDYKKIIKKSMDEAYVYYFQGKDIDVKIDEIWLIPYDENMADNLETTAFTVGFYEKDELIYTMSFGKVTPKKFAVYEDTTEGKPNFAANLIGYDDAILNICLRHATVGLYDKLVDGETVDRYGSGFVLGIEKNGSEESRQVFSEQLRERLKRLYTEGWYFKDVMFAPQEFDTEKNRWIYKVWFLSEDQESGTLAMLEQRFTYYNANLYVIEEEEPVVLVQSGEVPEEIERQLVELFR